MAMKQLKMSKAGIRRMKAVTEKIFRDWAKRHRKFEVSAVKHFNAAMVLTKRIDDAIKGKLGQVSGSTGDAWLMESHYHFVEALANFGKIECNLNDYKKGHYVDAFELTLWNVRLMLNPPDPAKGWPKDQIKRFKKYAKAPLRIG